MKELEDLVKDKVVNAAEATIEKQTKFVGTLRPKPGHKCWKCDMKTGKITEVEYVEEAVSFQAAQAGKIAPRRKVLVQEGFWYCTALNKKNAAKHFIRML